MDGGVFKAAKIVAIARRLATRGNALVKLTFIMRIGITIGINPNATCHQCR